MDFRKKRDCTIYVAKTKALTGKLFTSILNCRLQKYAEHFHLISENQAGFRKQYSTVDHIFSLRMLINILINQKKKLYYAFIDFQKAFDTGWREGLWLKNLKSNIRGKRFNVMYKLYPNIKSCVQVNGEYSAFFQCYLGVRQGDTVSPFLFSLCLNDLEHFLVSNGFRGVSCASSGDIEHAQVLLKLFTLLYADDTILITDSAEELQNGLNIFHLYCNQWKLKVNISKTKVVIFGKGRPATGIIFHYDNTEIEIVSKFNYSGVYFNRSVSFCTTIKHEQANKALTVHLRNIYHLKFTIDLQIDIFDRMITPI